MISHHHPLLTPSLMKIQLVEFRYISDPSLIQCPAVPILPSLIDGDLGPEGTDYTSSMVHTWHRSAQTVTITYTLVQNTELRHVNLYFYSIPSMGIGLPTVTLYIGSGNMSPVEYFISGNGNITQQDSMRRNVVLSRSGTGHVKNFGIQFDFENTDVEWLVLSETTLCDSSTRITISMVAPSLLPNTSPTTLNPDNLSPNLTLSCTVRGEGRFRWEWTGPDSIPPSAVILSHVTRTSTATFTNISDRAVGETVTFRCEATYNPMIINIENTVTQDINILLSEEIVEQTTVSGQTVTRPLSSATTENKDSTDRSSDSPTNTTTADSPLNIFAIALPVSLLLLLVGVMAGVLVLWRCTHHKHQYTVKEKASHTTSQTHTHPAISLCEETGQVQYESVPDLDNPSHTYSSVQPQAKKSKGPSSHADNSADLQEEEMGGYSVLSYGNKPSRSGGSTVMTSGMDNTSHAQLYSHVDKKNAAGRESVMNQLYAQVDKKKGKKEKKKHDQLPSSQALEMETPVDQLYAQVDKKKSKKGKKSDRVASSAIESNPPAQPQEMETPVDQLYAQVDKKKQKSKEKEVCPEESGAVYSVVNKPKPPQLPPQSQELLEELP